MSKFENGDKVWSVHNGWGVIRRLENQIYSVYVVYDNGNACVFTSDGKLYQNDRLPTLFYDEIKPEDWPNPPKPAPPLKVGDPVFTVDGSGQEHRRYYAGYVHDSRTRIWFYGDGRDAWTSGGAERTYGTEDWRRLTDEEMAEYKRLKGLE